MTATNVTLLTYNIHKGFTVGNLQFSLRGMREAIQSVSPSIVCLQEVQGKHKFLEKTTADWPGGDQANYLAEPTHAHVVYSENARYHAGHHGNAILSKFPIIEWENINVAKRDNASRSVLHAIIALPHHVRLHVLCVHFGLFKAERAGQLDTLSKRIAETIPSDEPILLAGDFNDWLQGAADYLELTLGMKEFFKEQNGEYAKSFPVYQPLLTVDRLYYRGATPITGRCLSSAPWNKLSDHAALYAEFTI